MRQVRPTGFVTTLTSLQPLHLHRAPCSLVQQPQLCRKSMSEIHHQCGDIRLQLSSTCVCRAASTAGRHSLQLMELLARAGAKPAAHADGVSHAEALSFWVTNLLPLQQAQRMAFARMTSTAERLRVRPRASMHRLHRPAACVTSCGDPAVQAVGHCADNQGVLQAELSILQQDGGSACRLM